MDGPAATPMDRLVRRLDLESQGPGCFLGHAGKGEGQLFGGLTLAQAVVAAGRTVGDRSVHSLHACFVRPGKYGAPIHFTATRLHDGSTFATRSVVAEQSGETILSFVAGFSRPEDGMSHQEPMPDAPAPDGLPDWEDLRVMFLADASKRRPDGPVEVRVCDPDSPDPTVRLPARRRVWLRPRGQIPDDPLLHAAVLVYATDRALLRTAARPHGQPWHLSFAASLDHAVWLHRPAQFDDWLLYVTESPVAHGGRALLGGAVYRRDGVRIASVAQEALLRW